MLNGNPLWLVGVLVVVVVACAIGIAREHFKGD